jgi:hypothetical protein
MPFRSNLFHARRRTLDEFQCLGTGKPARPITSSHNPNSAAGRNTLKHRQAMNRIEGDMRAAAPVGMLAGLAVVVFRTAKA